MRLLWQVSCRCTSLTPCFWANPSAKMGEGGWSRGQVFCVRCCSHKMGTVTRMFIRVIFDWHLYVYVYHPFWTVDYCGFMRTSVEDFVPQRPWLFFRLSIPLQSTNRTLLDHRISHTVAWSQNAVIKVCKVFQLQPAVIANSCASILAASAKVQYYLYLSCPAAEDCL